MTDDGYPLGADCDTDAIFVGGRRIRWWHEAPKCLHRNDNACPACTNLTEDEAAALRTWLDSLRANTSPCRGDRAADIPGTGGAPNIQEAP